MKSRTEELEKKAELEEQNFEENEEIDEEMEYEDEEEEEQSYPELTEERVEQFLLEIKSNCEQILEELPYEKRIKEPVREDIEYIVSTIIQDCEASDLKNAIALITALEYVVEKTKLIKIYTREMKNLLISFYDCD